MPNWTPITVADLNDAKAAKLVDNLRTKALATGQTDPTPRVTQQVVDEVRRKIASNTANRLDSDQTTVPKGLKAMVVDLVYFELKGRLLMQLSDDESDDRRRYERDLNRIAEGKDVVDQPDTPVTPEMESPVARPSFSVRPKYFDRTSQDGV